MQEPAPAREIVPGLHAVHTLAEELEYLPASQLSHTVTEPTENFPAAQLEQTDPIPLQYFPDVQVTQSVRESEDTREYEPTGQSKHVELLKY